MSANRLRSRFVHFYAERGFSAVSAALAVSLETDRVVPAAHIVHLSTDLILAAR